MRLSERLALRAAGMTFKPTLGNLKQVGGGNGGKGPKAGTGPVTSYIGAGQPLNIDAGIEQQAVDAYLGHVYVMRCVKLMAETVASLPWVAGLDPTDPADYTKDAPLANLLGPSTPQAPGGPNQNTSARAFWIWTICQYLVTGRFGWECQLDRMSPKGSIIGLYPLVSACLSPIPVFNGPKWFNGFQYQEAVGMVPLKDYQVIYCWRPSIKDWRLPESAVQAASLPIYVTQKIDQYMAALLKNGMVATTLVASPPFEEKSARRAWQDQFMAQFTGVDAAGRTIFAEVEADDEDTAGKPLIQVERIATSPLDGQLQTFRMDYLNDICIAMGTPRSLLGDASQRIYSNAGAEWKNYWTISVLDFLAELQDHVNLSLAPRLGTEVGWFDLARVAALAPPPIFMPPAITDAIEAGVATPDQIANVLQIPPANSTTDSDTDTVELGDEQAGNVGSSGGSGGRSAEWRYALRREWAQQLLLRDGHFDQAGTTFFPNQQALNVQTLRQGRAIKRVRHVVNTRALSLDGPGFVTARRVIERAERLRALAVADRTTQDVYDKLAENYPADTIQWAKEADWSGPKKVNLSDIAMARRPGGRDQAKVAGIAKAITEGDEGATEPVVLVKTPSGDLMKVADGYHRTLARKRLNQDEVDAYVGEVDSDEGPWDQEMHDAKLNRAVELEIVRAAGQAPAQGSAYSAGHTFYGNQHTGSLGAGGQKPAGIEFGGGLPPGITPSGGQKPGSGPKMANDRLGPSTATGSHSIANYQAAVEAKTKAALTTWHNAVVAKQKQAAATTVAAKQRAASMVASAIKSGPSKGSIAKFQSAMQATGAAPSTATDKALAAAINGLSQSERSALVAAQASPPSGFMWDLGSHTIVPGQGHRSDEETQALELVLALADLDDLDLEGVRYDVSPLGEGKNWVTKVGGLPLFARAIAHALIRSGHTESDAIAIAIAAMKRWSAGGGKVTPKTRAKSAANVAEWEAKKVAAHAS